MTDHAPLLGRRAWWRLCAGICCEVGGDSRRFTRKRRTKRVEARAVRREIDAALIERHCALAVP